MNEEKFVAEVRTPQELYAVLATGEQERIVICGHIVCENEIILTNFRQLVGKDNESCLEFHLEKKLNPVALTMGDQTSLENLVIKVVVAANNVCCHYSSAVLIDGVNVSFRSVRLSVETTGKVSSEEIPIFPVVYLRHFLEVFGCCSVKAKGISAAALSGDFTSTAQFCQRNGVLEIVAEESRVPVISRCLLRVEKGVFSYTNCFEYAPQSEVFSAYIFLQKGVVFYNASSCTAKMKNVSLCNGERELFLTKKAKPAVGGRGKKKSFIRKILNWFG